MIKIFLGGHGKDECGQSGHGTLKFTVSSEWMNWMNWSFACCCKFLCGQGQNGHGHLIHETLNYAEWVYAIIFG